MVDPPKGDSDAEFELARRAVQLGWLSREQVEVALLEVELLPSSRLLTHLPLTPDQIRKLEQAPASLPKELVPASADPARRVAQYILGDYQKAGGMGKVVKAWDTRLSRWVALKFLKKLDDKRLRAYFEEEARLAAGLSHPNIAAIYEIGEHDGAPFIAMQFVDGRTLDEARRGMDPREAARIVRDAAHAVGFAHESGIIHRDLKPSNVMIDAKGRVFVMDFGLATQTEVTSSRRTPGGARTISGTPEYVSPEEARGDEADDRTDVHGLGATLYHLITGSPPNAGKSMAEILRKMEKADRPAPRRLNPRIETDLETIVLKCLEPDRSRRYPTAKELAEDLDRYLNRDPIAARRQSPVYRLRMKFAKLKMALAAALATVALIVTAAIVVPMWRSEASARAGHEDRRVRFERARPHLESGWTLIQRMRLRMREEYTPADLKSLGAQAHGYFDKALGFAPDLPEAFLGKAHVHVMTHERDQALSALARAIKADSGFAPAYLERVRLQIDAYETRVHDRDGGPGHVTPETEMMRIQLESDLSKAQLYSKDYPRQNYAKALFHFSHGEFEKAADLLGAYVEIDAEDALAHYWRGHALDHLDRQQEAIDSFTQALRRNTRFAAAANMRGRSLRKLGRLDEAIVDHTRAIKLDPNRSSAHHNLGLANAEKGLRTLAITSFSSAIGLEPDNWEYLHSRGRARRLEGLIEDALLDLNRAIELNDRFVEAYVTRGALWSNDKDLPDRAILDFDKAIGLDPKHVGAHYNRGVAMEKGSHFEEAMASYAKAIELDANYSSAYLNRGALLNEKGLYDRAIEDFKRFIALNPNHAFGYNNLGKAEYGKGMHDKAIESFTTAIDLDSTYGTAWMNRGNAFFAKGQIEPAIQNLSKAIDLNPRDALAYVNRGRVWAAQDMFDNAMADFEMAIKWGAQDPVAYFQRGLARAKWGMITDAIDDYTKAVVLNPRYAEAYANRGNMKVCIGLTQEAVADWKKALQLAPSNWSYRKAVEERVLSRGVGVVFQWALKLQKWNRHRESIELFKVVVESKARPQQALASAYNIACAYANLGDSSTALDWLEKAAVMGWKDVDQLEKNADLESLRGEERYRKLVARLKSD